MFFLNLIFLMVLFITQIKENIYVIFFWSVTDGPNRLLILYPVINHSAVVFRILLKYLKVPKPIGTPSRSMRIWITKS